MIPFYEHAGTTSWTMRPQIIDGRIFIPQGELTNSTGVYSLPDVTIEPDNIISITIVEKDGTAYYVLWQEDCVMEQGYNHLLELAWKEGTVWRYVENESSWSSDRLRKDRHT